MKWFLLCLTLPSLALAADPKAAPAKPAEAAKPDPKVLEEGAKLFKEKTCLACHGKDAKTPILPDYPKLAGQNAAYAERQMLDIKSGARANGNTAAMKGIMHLVTEAEIHTISLWLSVQP